MLALEEGQLFGGGNGELVREIQTRIRILATPGVERILSEGQRGATHSGAEDFAHVIERTAVGISSAYAELVEQIIGAEFSLQAVVIGVAAVIALQHDSLGAINPTRRGIRGLSRTKQDLRT